MTKLDEIEATYNGLMSGYRYEDADEYMSPKLSLLLRAVRQLAEAWQKSVDFGEVTADLTDSDVLELLEQA